jgi:hypothetical protein
MSWWKFSLLPDEVSEGQRGAAAGRSDGGVVGVGPQIVVLFSHIFP